MMFARAERRTLRTAGGLALGGVLVFVGAATAILLGHAGGGSGAPLFDAYIGRVAQFTLMQAVLSTVLSVALAIPVARALARQRDFSGRVWILRLSAVPLGLPALVAALGVIEIWGRQGVVNDLLRLAGLQNPISVYGLSGILIAHVFFNLPLAARFLVAALDRIPAEYWLTSANLGMGSGATFRLIEWPVIRRVLPGVAGLIFMLCATSFTIVLTLGGGPAATTIEVAIYQALRFDFDPQRAVLLAFLQIAVTAALLWLLSLFGQPPEEGMTAGRAIRRFDGRKRRLPDGLVILAFKQLSRHRLRSLLTILGVAMSMFLFATVETTILSTPAGSGSLKSRARSRSGRSGTRRLTSCSVQPYGYSMSCSTPPPRPTSAVEERLTSRPPTSSRMAERSPSFSALAFVVSP